APRRAPIGDQERRGPCPMGRWRPEEADRQGSGRAPMNSSGWRWSSVLWCTVPVLMACGKSRQNGESAGPEAASSTAAGLASGGTGGDATTDADASVDTPLCDGSDGLRFSAVVVAGNVNPEQLVRWELGARFLFVQGYCKYWVSGPNVPTLFEHCLTCTLSDAERVALQYAFLWAHWE